MAESSEDDGERSEEPTQKKLDEARKRGDVVKSQEVNNWFLLGGAALALSMFSSDAASDLTLTMKGFMSNAHAIAMDGIALRGMVYQLTLKIIATIGLPMVILMAAALLGNIVQHGLLWTTEPITPKLSKISITAAFGRLFSKQSLANFVKGIAKLVVVGAAVTAVVWPEKEKLSLLAGLDLVRLMPYSLHLALEVFATAVAVLTVLAIADYLYQRHTWFERQRMSFREIKEEYKQLEGNPEIKAKIRQLRVERSRRRMMAQVPQASVIITNPTHYAVALRYEDGMNAPLCLAKGMDAIALKIRSTGEEHKVPIVENPPLARALYASVDVDEEIPTEHYRAVAEVIGYVMRLRRGRR